MANIINGRYRYYVGHCQITGRWLVLDICSRGHRGIYQDRDQAIMAADSLNGTTGSRITRING